MNDEYIQEVRQCARKIHEIDLKHIAPNFGKGKIGPGDPPNWRRLLLAELDSAARVADVVGVDVPTVAAPSPEQMTRRSFAPR